MWLHTFLEDIMLKRISNSPVHGLPISISITVMLSRCPTKKKCRNLGINVFMLKEKEELGWTNSTFMQQIKFKVFDVHLLQTRISGNLAGKGQAINRSLLSSHRIVCEENCYKTCEWVYHSKKWQWHSSIFQQIRQIRIRYKISNSIKITSFLSFLSFVSIY